jgi:hypothetical protein
MSVFWGHGGVYIAGFACYFIQKQSCAASELPAYNSVHEGIACCTRNENGGWRNLVLVMGCTLSALFVCRLIFVHLFESPKILMGKRRQREAVEVARTLAWCNSKSTWYSEETLDDIGGISAEPVDEERTAVIELLRSKVQYLSRECLDPLFAGTRQKVNTLLIWFYWMTMSIAMPLFVMFLPGYLAKTDHGNVIVPIKAIYRNLIFSTISMLGCPIADFLVSTKLGRKYTMAAPTLLGGVFITVFTQLKTCRCS